MICELREMTLDDYTAVYELWQSTEKIGLSSADSRECIDRYLARNPGMSVVAQRGGAVVGALPAVTMGGVVICVTWPLRRNIAAAGSEEHWLRRLLHVWLLPESKSAICSCSAKTVPRKHSGPAPAG